MQSHGSEAPRKVDAADLAKTDPQRLIDALNNAQEVKAEKPSPNANVIDFDPDSSPKQKWRKQRAETVLKAGKTFVVADARTLANVLEKLATAVRYNVRSSAYEIRFGSGAWEPLSSRKESALRETIARKFRLLRSDPPDAQLRWTEPRWRTALDDATPEADPFEEWLLALPEWDGRPRIDTILRRVFDIKDTPLTQFAARHLFMGVVARTMYPGSKSDETVVLIGGQGLGKSTYFAWTLPPEHRAAWFTDSFAFTNDDKWMIERTSGAVVVEASEFIGVRRAEVERIKNFLSRQSDKVRFAYRKDAEVVQRRFVIVGSSNSPECLPADVSGNRRFVPVQCEKRLTVPQIRETLNREREQLWAEALARILGGERHWLDTRELVAEQKELTDRHRSRDSTIEDKINELVATRDRTLNEIATDLRMLNDHTPVLSRGDEMRLSDALRLLGWEKRRRMIGGAAATRWSKT